MSAPVECFASEEIAFGIRLEVAQRVGLGARGLAEHVVGIEIAFRGHRAAALDRLGDGAAEHELLAHLAHRRGDRGADHRLAEPAHHRAQRAFDAALAFVEHAAGQHQRPGRGVDEDRGRAARMRRPVLRRDLVADQLVHRLGVGHAQQRLGEAHQRHAFLGREAVGGEEDLHQPRVGRAAHRPHQIGGMPGDCGALRVAELRGRDQAFQRLVLVGQIVGADFVAESGKRRHGLSKASGFRGRGNGITNEPASRSEELNQCVPFGLLFVPNFTSILSCQYA